MLLMVDQTTSHLGGVYFTEGLHSSSAVFISSRVPCTLSLICTVAPRRFVLHLKKKKNQLFLLLKDCKLRQLLRSVLSILFLFCEMGNTCVCSCTQVLVDFFPSCITEKQNGRGCQVPVVQPPKTPVVQDHVKTGFERILRHSTTSLGNPCRCSATLTVRVFPEVQMKLHFVSVFLHCLWSFP